MFGSHELMSSRARSFGGRAARVTGPLQIRADVIIGQIACNAWKLQRLSRSSFQRLTGLAIIYYQSVGAIRCNGKPRVLVVLM